MHAFDVEGVDSLSTYIRFIELIGVKGFMDWLCIDSVWTDVESEVVDSGLSVESLYIDFWNKLMCTPKVLFFLLSKMLEPQVRT